MDIIYPQNPLFYIAVGSAAILVFLLLFSFFSSKKKSNLRSSLDMSLFLIKLPKYEKAENEKADIKDEISKIEQVFSNFLI